ncbi:ABC transporter substrate-binding protein [Methylocella tundrae]|uniref:ABC transporter substrate-binding protein n=1 Tax=Methylocella tundrae TaxID=227605 RepID=UPI0030FEB1AC|nr:ABC transporter substrate-binding protein [Methylocella tundrae]
MHRNLKSAAGAAFALFWLLALQPLSSASAAAVAEGAAAPSGVAPLTILYLAGDYPKAQYLSLLQTEPDDDGEAGARLALSEINLTGKFVGRQYAMDVVHLKPGAVVATEAKPLLARYSLVIADLTAPDLLAAAKTPEAKDAIILDMRTSEDSLRQEQCARNIFHLLPSTAMRADALAQFLVAKGWRRWLLLRGAGGADAAFADDIRLSAARFGGKIVEDRRYAYDAGSRRVDTGYQQIQTQMPLATSNAPPHDVVVVADEADLFGDYLPYNTFESRLIAGTQGLVPVAWHPAYQEYSALQMQHRFEIAAHRPMTERDYAGWLAIRTIGEAVIRSGKTDTKSLGDFLRGDDFGIAAFKGQALSFRRWDQQLRQPVLLATPLMVVSMSPQEGFLHPKFLTDTLGYDEPETRCRFTQ